MSTGNPSFPAPGTKKEVSGVLSEELKKRIMSLLSEKMGATTGRPGFSEEEAKEMKEKIGEDKFRTLQKMLANMQRNAFSKSGKTGRIYEYEEMIKNQARELGLPESVDDLLVSNY